VNEVPIGNRSVVATVLAHRRDADAIAKRDGAECERLE